MSSKSVTSLASAFKALRPFSLARPQSATFVGITNLHTSSKRLAELPPSDRPTIGASSIFDSLDKPAQVEEQVSDKVIPHEEREYHWASANFKTSPQKLNKIARQLRNLNVDDAIKQMEFSHKRISSKVLHNLAFARKNAKEQKGFENLVISQAWVGKGRYIKRIKPHGRGRWGIMHHKEAHIKFILKEAPSAEELSKQQKRNIRGWNDSKKVWTSMVENKPVYNGKGFYNW
ncbi:39S ribosomal protein L22 [Umbelopsis nana]